MANELTVQAFCARVIGLCHGAADIGKTTFDLALYQRQAKALEQEVNQIQDLYGGRQPKRKER